MEIIIDIDASIPLFAQLIAQIKRAVLSDNIGPGDPLPSIRQLANDLRLNSKTVAKAYDYWSATPSFKPKAIAERLFTRMPKPTARSI